MAPPVGQQFFPEGDAPNGLPYAYLRWSDFKDRAPETAFDLVDKHVFPFLHTLGADGSTYAAYMEGARLTVLHRVCWRRSSTYSATWR